MLGRIGNSSDEVAEGTVDGLSSVLESVDDEDAGLGVKGEVKCDIEVDLEVEVVVEAKVIDIETEVELAGFELAVDVKVEIETGAKDDVELEPEIGTSEGGVVIKSALTADVLS